VYTNTADVTKYLVQNAKNDVKTGSTLIAKIHEDLYDPNFPFCSLYVQLLDIALIRVFDNTCYQRNDEELNAKPASFPRLFLSNRQPLPLLILLQH